MTQATQSDNPGVCSALPGELNAGVQSEFAVSAVLRARLLAGLIGLGGLILFVVALTAMLLSWPPVALATTAGLIALLVLLGGWLLTRRWYVVRLDREGYRVRFVRGAGTTAARWSDVEDVVATTLDDDRCVVLRLRDGRTTTIPVDVLAVAPTEFVDALRSRLNSRT